MVERSQNDMFYLISHRYSVTCWKKTQENHVKGNLWENLDFLWKNVIRYVKAVQKWSDTPNEGADEENLGYNAEKVKVNLGALFPGRPVIANVSSKALLLIGAVADPQSNSVPEGGLSPSSGRPVVSVDPPVFGTGQICGLTIPVPVFFFFCDLVKCEMSFQLSYRRSQECASCSSVSEGFYALVIGYWAVNCSAVLIDCKAVHWAMPVGVFSVTVVVQKMLPNSFLIYALFGTRSQRFRLRGWRSAITALMGADHTLRSAFHIFPARGNTSARRL